MKEDLQKLSEYGQNKQASWRKDVLGLDDVNVLRDIEPVAPLQYLKSGKKIFNYYRFLIIYKVFIK